MSALSDTLVYHIRALGLPAPQTELAFAPPRRWRFDMAYPEQHLAIEVDGGTWTGGRHSRGTGYEADCEKLNAAVLTGWRVLRFTGDMVRDGRAVDVIRQALMAFQIDGRAVDTIKRASEGRQ